MMDMQREYRGAPLEHKETEDREELERRRERLITALIPYLEYSPLSPREWNEEHFDKQVAALREYVVFVREAFPGLKQALSHETEFRDIIGRAAKRTVVKAKERLGSPYSTLTRFKGETVDRRFTEFIHHQQNNDDDWREMLCVDPDIPVSIHHKKYLTTKWKIDETDRESSINYFASWYEGIYEALDEFFANPTHRQIRIKVGSSFDTLITATDHMVIYSYKENDPALEELERLLQEKIGKRGFQLGSRPLRSQRGYDFDIWDNEILKSGALGNLGQFSSHSSIIAALIFLELRDRGLSFAGNSPAAVASVLDRMIAKYNFYDPDQAWETLQVYRPKPASSFSASTSLAPEADRLGVSLE